MPLDVINGGPREIVNNNQTNSLVGFFYKGQMWFGDLKIFDHMTQMITLTVITLSGGFHCNPYFKKQPLSKLFLKKEKGIMKAFA